MNVNSVVMEPLDALRVLVVARKGLIAGKYSALQRKLIPFLKHTTKLQLPYTLTYPLPTHDKRARTHIRKCIQQVMRTHRVPAQLRAYYMAILTIPVTQGRTIKSAMTDNHVSMSLASMHSELRNTTHCACRVRDKCTHATVYGTEQVQTIVPERFWDVIRAPANGKIQPSVSHVYRTLRRNAELMYRKMPTMHRVPTKTLVQDAAQCILKGRQTRVRNPRTDPHVTRTHIRAMKESIPGYKFVHLDKSAWCYVVCCAAFRMHTVYQAYNRKEYVLVQQYSNVTECQSVMFLYYYFLSVAFPALTSCHPMRTARRHISKAMPWIKGHRLPCPDKVTERIDSHEKATPVRRRLLQLAEEVCDVARKNEAKGLGSIYTLHVPNVTTSHTTPNTTCAGKNNTCIPVPQGGEMATREMFSHAKHPLERPLKQVSRISSLLERHYTCAFVTLNVPPQHHLITGFLQPAREYFLTQSEAVGGGGASSTSSVCSHPSAVKKSCKHTKHC